ncbi:MAG TPA: hypothetical protein VFB31_15160 [Pseudolabrys sp.]|nr:hypothetical protein [Pseudolabrys sp.]
MLKLFSPVLLVAFVFAAVPEIDPAWSAPALTAQTSDQAGVRVVVTPKTLGAGVKVWEFDIVMDTHTKTLNENLVQVAALVDDAGRRYAPIAWQGDAPGGHHRKGILQFSAPAEMPKSVELQISGVAGVESRAFRWDLN